MEISAFQYVRAKISVLLHKKWHTILPKAGGFFVCVGFFLSQVWKERRRPCGAGAMGDLTCDPLQSLGDRGG